MKRATILTLTTAMVLLFSFGVAAAAEDSQDPVRTGVDGLLHALLGGLLGDEIDPDYVLDVQVNLGEDGDPVTVTVRQVLTRYLYEILNESGSGQSLLPSEVLGLVPLEDLLGQLSLEEVLLPLSEGTETVITLNSGTNLLKPLRDTVNQLPLVGDGAPGNLLPGEGSSLLQPVQDTLQQLPLGDVLKPVNQIVKELPLVGDLAGGLVGGLLPDSDEEHGGDGASGGNLLEPVLGSVNGLLKGLLGR